jgi:hypothetical protein
MCIFCLKNPNLSFFGHYQTFDTIVKRSFLKTEHSIKNSGTFDVGPECMNVQKLLLNPTTTIPRLKAMFNNIATHVFLGDKTQGHAFYQNLWENFTKAPSNFHAI